MNGKALEVDDDLDIVIEDDDLTTLEELETAGVQVFTIDDDTVSVPSRSSEEITVPIHVLRQQARACGDFC